MPKGLRIGANVSIGPGERAVATLPATTAVTTSHAKGRQREGGSRPLGNSSPKNAKSLSAPPTARRPPKRTPRRQAVTQAALAASSRRTRH
jgi:hypothetical protein